MSPTAAYPAHATALFTEGGKAGYAWGEPEDLPEPSGIFRRGFRKIPRGKRQETTSKTQRAMLKSILQKSLYWCGWLGFAGGFVAFSQSVELLRVFVLNEGRYDYWTQTQVVPVTLGVIDLQTGTYTVFDTIEGARFGVDLEIDSGYLYVTADSYLLKYDLQTLERVAQAKAPGLRHLTIHGDRIYVARGDIGCCNSYLQVYDKRDLSLIMELDTASTLLKWSTEDVLVLNDTLYLIANNAFVWGQQVGYLVRAPINNLQAMDTFSLQSNGLNPEALMTDGIYLYTLNNNDFTFASISRYAPNVADNSPTKVTTVSLPVVSGCKGAVLAWNTIYYQPYYADLGVDTIWGDEVPFVDMVRFSTANMVVLDTLPVNRATLYQFHFEPLNGQIWVTETDFVNWGLILVFDSLMQLVDAYPAGIGAGALAFEYGVRTVSGTPTVHTGSSPTIQVIQPGPTVYLRWHSREQPEIVMVHVMDVHGRVVQRVVWRVAHQPILAISLPSGWYSLVVTDLTGSVLYRTPVWIVR